MRTTAQILWTLFVYFLFLIRKEKKKGSAFMCSGLLFIADLLFFFVISFLLCSELNAVTHFLTMCVLCVHQL